MTRKALGKLRPLHTALRALWSVAALLGLASPASAQDCRLALVLALDVSASVDEAEYSLQREGLARALMDRTVVRAFLAGDPVALYIFEWASPSMQEPIGNGWLLVESEDDLARMADVLLSLPRTGGSDRQLTTGLGAALIHTAGAFEEAPDCRAHTVDVSGDGRNNSGLGPRSVYASYPFDDVTVNALVINAEPDGGHPGADEQLIVWFRANVLLGQDAFWLSADGYEDFERAMRMKLLRELQAADVSGWPTSDGAG